MNTRPMITRIVVLVFAAMLAAVLIGRANLFLPRNDDPLCKEAYRAVIEKENPIVTGYEFPDFGDCIVTHEGKYYVVTGRVVVLSEGQTRRNKDFVSAVHRNPTNGNWLLIATKVYSAEPDPL